MKSITSILAVLALGTTLAIADDAKTEPATTTPATTTSGKPKVDPAEMFKKLDTNGDGKLSLEEWMASKRAQKDPDKAKEFFTKRDKGNKGYLTPEEFAGHGGKKGDAAPAAPAAPAANK